MKPWGCPQCRSHNGRVTETGRDEDGYKIRLRRCVDCGSQWATEEVPISREAYGARTQRSFHEAARRRAQPKPCATCGALYQPGSFRAHVARNPVHAAAIKPIHRDIKRHRAYQREWARKQRASLHDLRCAGPGACTCTPILVDVA